MLRRKMYTDDDRYMLLGFPALDVECVVRDDLEQILPVAEEIKKPIFKPHSCHQWITREGKDELPLRDL